jgi:hypothetical protein
VALGCTECEAVAEALAVARCEIVVPETGAAVAESSAEGLTAAVAVGVFRIAASGEPAAGDGVETSTIAARAPTLTIPAAVSVNTRLRRLR